MVEKFFKIGLAVLIQYRRVTDRHPVSQSRCRSKDRAYVYVARVKSEAWITRCGKVAEPDPNNAYLTFAINRTINMWLVILFTHSTLCIARSMPSCGVCLSVCLSVCHTPLLCLNQCRLIQWARRARAQGPQASGGPQTADALIFFIS